MLFIITSFISSIKIYIIYIYLKVSACERNEGHRLNPRDCQLFPLAGVCILRCRYCADYIGGIKYSGIK